MIIRFILFFLGTVVFLSTASQAQNKITVIHDDGTKEVIILNENPIAEPQPTPEIVTPAPEPALTAEDLISPPSQPMIVEDAPKIEEIKAPKPKTKAVASPPKKRTAPKVKSVEKQEKTKAQTPIPLAKPNEEEIIKAMNAKPLIDHIDPTNIPEGTPITQDLAVRAALEVAPPSSGFDVYGVVYEGRPSFQVRFKTEGGPHDIVIDGYTGDVLKK
ncbi:MAG: hypothetical protein R3D88_06665 [Alphaproteobacteria bacterium]|nr:hypothetical protein [Alphaproteobacteria bacterium]